MNILALKSSGDETAISVMLDKEINTFSMSHNRKDRPNWEMFLDNVGHNRIFKLVDIDLFVFANNQNSFTATRIIASYLKGIATALNKPLISIEDNPEDNFETDQIVIMAKERYLAEENDLDKFNPRNVNPTYNANIEFKKLNE